MPILFHFRPDGMEEKGHISGDSAGRPSLRKLRRSCDEQGCDFA